MDSEPRSPDTVTASEIADYVFCLEAWRLAQIGHPSPNWPIRNAGTVHHADLTTSETVATGAIAIGWWLVILAAVVLGLRCVTF
jgi:hypothetical protein